MIRSSLRFIQTTVILGLALGVMGPARADLVLNGSFQSGDFTSWALAGDTESAPTYVSGSPGNFAAALGTTTADGLLMQTLDTVAGQHYTFSFQLAGDGGVDASNNVVNSFTATLGSTQLLSLTNVPLTLPDFTTYSFEYTASSSSSLLSFDFRDDPGYLYLTDISVVASTAVPEPPAIVGLALGLLIVSGYLWRKHHKPSLALAA